MRDGGAHAVGVGIGGHHKARLDLLGKVERKLQCLTELGVGIRAGGEVSIGLGLLLDHGDVLNADLLEDAAHALHARAIERCVDHGVGGVGLEAGDGDLLDVVDEGVKHLLGRPLDEALGEALVEVHALDVLERVDPFDVGTDLRRRLVRDLATVVVVDLVAIVLGGVMGGREHDACGGVQVAHREGQRGDGLDAGIHEHVDAIGGKHASGHLLEVLAFEAAVARQGQRRLVIVRIEVVRQALRCLGHHMDVHAIGANAQHATQTRRAKGELTIEGIVELLLLTGQEALEFLLEVLLGDVVLPVLNPRLRLLIHV